MTRLFRSWQGKVARAPGTMEHVGEKKVEKITAAFMDYDESGIKEHEVADIAECFPLKDLPTTSWINVNGLHDTELLQKLCNHFGLHPLVQEDIVNTHQRPKMEDHGDYMFIVCRMIAYDNEQNEIRSEQISLVLGTNFVLSFQEYAGDVFEPVRERIRNGKGRIRKMGSDYLAYALLDAVVDNYFLIIEKFGDQIETLEEELLDDPTPQLLQTIHELKRELILLRRSVWPLREVVSSIERAETKLLKKTVLVFFRDVYDHTIQVADAVESFRDMISGLQDLYLSSLSNRMNEIMKVLTIIATIFVPLTFVAGIYGMNFEHMPELGWKWSYLIFWVVIAAIGGGMLRFFRGKKWL